jgi:hypothetical protein
MPTLLDRKKHFAAAVMIAFLATLVSAIGIPEAGKRAFETPGSACHFKEAIAKSKIMLRLELGEKLSFHGRLCPASNFFDALGEMLYADNFFLIAYSALNLSFFLFLAAIGRARPPLLWILTGSLLALVMLSADLWENSYIRQWIDHSGTVPLSPSVFTATAVKWGAIAVASGLLGRFYWFHSPRLGKVVAVPAFAAAALLAAGLACGCWQWIDWASTVLAVLWLFILIHAVIVALESPPPGRGEKHV